MTNVLTNLATYIEFDHSLSSVSKTKENSMPWQQYIYQNPHLSGFDLYPLQKRYGVLLNYFTFNSATNAANQFLALAPQACLEQSKSKVHSSFVPTNFWIL